MVHEPGFTPGAELIPHFRTIPRHLREPPLLPLSGNVGPDSITSALKDKFRSLPQRTPDNGESGRECQRVFYPYVSHPILRNREKCENSSCGVVGCLIESFSVQASVVTGQKVVLSVNIGRSFCSASRSVRPSAITTGAGLFLSRIERVIGTACQPRATSRRSDDSDNP